MTAQLVWLFFQCGSEHAQRAREQRNTPLRPGDCVRRDARLYRQQMEIVRHDLLEAHIGQFAPEGFVACSWVHRYKSRRAGENPDRQLKLTAENLFTALADTREAPEAQLPQTGVGPALERKLSAAFITGAEYGTRASSLLLLDDAEIVLHERRYGPHGHFEGQSILRIPLKAAAIPPRRPMA